MANGDRQFEFIRQLLELNLPQSHTVPVTPTGVSRDQKTVGFGIPLLPHSLPPPANSVHCKARGVMICPDGHPSYVTIDVVNAVRHSTLQLWIDEVVGFNFFRVALIPLPDHSEFMMYGNDVMVFTY